MFDGRRAPSRRERSAAHGQEDAQRLAQPLVGSPGAASGRAGSRRTRARGDRTRAATRARPARNRPPPRRRCRRVPRPAPPFTDKQIELVQTFADQAVIAIENVRLFEEVQARTRELSEALEQQTATSEVLRVISSSPGELEPVFQAMLENATRICDAKFGNLLLYEGTAFRVAAMHGAPPAWAELRRRDPILRFGPKILLPALPRPGGCSTSPTFEQNLPTSIASRGR